MIKVNEYFEVKGLNYFLRWFLLVLSFEASLTSAPLQSVPTYVNEVEAMTMKSYQLQGEYLSILPSSFDALQIVALAGDRYRVVVYPEGLPSKETKDQKVLISEVLQEQLYQKTMGFQKIKRVSPTMGLKPPAKAKIIFVEGKGDFDGEVNGDFLRAGASSKFEVGSFYMHLEFKLPYKPDRTPSSQDRGNSGVYIFNRYEIQVLDTFGLDLNEANNPGTLESEKERWCGALYKTKAPMLNMALPPLDWQTYDINFSAPEVDAEGKKVMNAKISVRHNGEWIHSDLVLEQGTGAGAKKVEVARERIYFQDHGNPAEYRNVWLIEKE